MEHGGRYALPQRGMKTGAEWGNIGSMPWAIEAEYGLAMRGCV